MQNVSISHYLRAFIGCFLLLAVVFVPKASGELANANHAKALGAGGNVLADAQWEHRLLAICGAQSAALGSELQLSQFAEIDWSGYLERKLLVVGVSSDAVSVAYIERLPNGDTFPGVVKFYEHKDLRLVRAANCESGEPSLSLIGLDGGVKEKWYEPVPNDELFAIIDAMPMRAQEMWRDVQE